MASSAPNTPADTTGARAPLTSEELAAALKVELFDAEGKTKTLGELVKGQRSVLVFTRHYWCVNCHAYVRAISTSIPPSNLPPNTQILFINNGSYQPIKAYQETTSSAYPIYTDPTCRIHEILKFKATLKESGNGEEKRDYIRDASRMNRFWTGLKGALGHLEHTSYVGPKNLNGGEVVLSADGECEFIYRMQNTVDHINVSELASIIGVKMVSTEGEEKGAPAAAEVSAVTPASQ